MKNPNEKPVEMSKSNDSTTGNLFDYLQYYKLIGKNYSRQTNVTIPQKFKSTQKVEKNIM